MITMSLGWTAILAMIAYQHQSAHLESINLFSNNFNMIKQIKTKIQKATKE